MELRPAVAAAAAAAPPQPLLCSCSDDHQLLFWRRAGAAWAPAAAVTGATERPVYSVDWAPGAAPVVAAACGDNSLLLLSAWEDGEGVHAGVAARVPEAHRADVNSVSFAPFGTLTDGGVLLATGGDDNLVQLWQVCGL
ncbi:hypothetical protein STCU_01934 [Strigomonas culicis]|uniref:Uncharacterized protein n=1 Tax=Strigomonas culicis TaxID=28005 RepID=S9US98_9TRYP|nr:hypothetical protein STCU_05446 [Strigomonas culicis]EPY33832.1 hypothetical protein STCU_01934 [Strigomonas culicis]|eukprot:EPY27892.1 hypothetical protein STCU_05446 [Strigomonas culicis]